MELRQLRYFVKAAETLNFSEAAKGLYITQSTLSQQIRQLETELDVQLFQRNSHEVTLTEAGAELLPYAKRNPVCRRHVQRTYTRPATTAHRHTEHRRDLFVQPDSDGNGVGFHETVPRSETEHFL